MNGIVIRHKRKRGNETSTTFGKMMMANSIEIREKSFEDIEISPDEEKNILAASKDPLIYSNMMQSIAPSIYGMEIEKSALLLQLFGVDRHTGGGGRHPGGNVSGIVRKATGIQHLGLNRLTHII